MHLWLVSGWPLGLNAPTWLSMELFRLLTNLADFPSLFIWEGNSKVGPLGSWHIEFHGHRLLYHLLH